MHLKPAALLASAWILSCGAALAQIGDAVTVNPVAGGGGMLLYPGGEYMRLVPPLLQPGENPRDTGPIQLHMPGQRKAQATVSAARAPRKVAADARPPTPPTAPPSDSGSFFSSPAPAAPPAPPAPAPKPSRPAQVASVAPPPPEATPGTEGGGPSTAGLTKRSVILFAPQATDPAKGALGAIKFLAGSLNAAMTSSSSRIELYAYGGARGDKSSDARRLSLKRALAIRQVLIDDGVSADRIDLVMRGGADDDGPLDRVDVYIKA